MIKRPPKKNLASRARHWVDFQQKTRVSDGEGGFTVTWTNITGATRIPVEILPIMAKRREEMRSLNVRATHYIRSRSYIPVEEIGRMSWGDRVFEVLTVENIQERDCELFITANELRP